MTNTYSVTYLVRIEDGVPHPESVATFWLKKILESPDRDLPDFVESVTTVPTVTKIVTDTPKPKPNTKPKGNA